MKIFNWLFGNHTITVSDRDYKLEDLQKQIIDLRARVEDLEVNSMFQAIDNSKPIIIPEIKIRPTIRSSNNLIQLMERRSALAAAMAKEAPKPEEVK